jgi:hypothetical protein
VDASNPERSFLVHWWPRLKDRPEGRMACFGVFGVFGRQNGLLVGPRNDDLGRDRAMATLHFDWQECSWIVDKLGLDLPMPFVLFGPVPASFLVE